MAGTEETLSGLATPLRNFIEALSVNLELVRPFNKIRHPLPNTILYFAAGLIATFNGY
jgi:hypothetical protein